MKFEMKSKNNRAAGSSRRYSFEVSLPGLVGIGSALLLGLVWVFIFGVLVGRGYDAGAAVADSENPTPMETAEVIPPEDLTFFDQLQDRPAPAQQANDQAAQETAAAEPQSEVRQSVETPPAQDQAPPEPADTASSDNQIYDYLYQVASFRNEQSANALRDRVQGLGLRAEVERSDNGGQIWYRVNVRFQGRPEDTRAMKEKLGTLGLDHPLLRSKVPA